MSEKRKPSDLFDAPNIWLILIFCQTSEKGSSKMNKNQKTRLTSLCGTPVNLLIKVRGWDLNPNASGDVTRKPNIYLGLCAIDIPNKK
jgi:hypothetical protein